MIRRICLIALLLAGSAGTGAAAPAAMPEVLVDAAVLPGWRDDDGRQVGALHFRLAPGWKTYWRSPGEAGIPPSFDWTGSTNVARLDLVWPRPEIFDLAGMRTLAYPDELVLPFVVTPRDPGQPVSIVARIDMGVCDEICVPLAVTLSGELAHDARPDPVISRAMAARPDDSADLGLPAAKCAAEPIRDGLRMTTDVRLGHDATDGFAVIELADRPTWMMPVTTEGRDGALRQVTDIVPEEAAPFALNRSQVLITVFAGGEVVEFRGCTG